MNTSCVQRGQQFAKAQSMHSQHTEGGKSRKKSSQILIEGMLIDRDVPKEKTR